MNKWNKKAADPELFSQVSDPIELMDTGLKTASALDQPPPDKLRQENVQAPMLSCRCVYTMETKAQVKFLNKYVHHMLNTTQ